MQLERRHAVWILVLGAWTVLIWVTFARNLASAYVGGEDRPSGYWVAHTVLIVVNLALGVVFAVLGTKILRNRSAS